MENLLSSIVLSQKETKKALDKQTDILESILKIEQDRASIDKRRLNEEKKATRQGKKERTDKSLVQQMFGDPKKEGKKQKKGMFDWLTNFLGGIFGGGAAGLAPLLAKLGIGAAIGGALFKLFTDKKFRDGVMSGLFGKGGIFGPENRQALFSGVTDFLFGKDGILKSFEGVAAAAAALAVVLGPGKLLGAVNGIAKAASGLLSILPGITTGFKGLASFFGGAVFAKILALIGAPIAISNTAGFLVDQVQNNRAGGDAGGGPLRRRINEELNAFKRTIPGVGRSGAQARQRELDANAGYQERESIRQQIFDATAELDAARKAATTTTGRGANRTTTTDQAAIDAAEAKYQRKIAELEARFEALDPLKRQRGGPINVPGTGSGDKVPMLLPGGSFVMNRNAAAMLQSGGLVPTLLEPGEKVFGPGQYGPMEMMLNSTFSRFQEGGSVTGDGRPGDPDEPSNATHAYLTALNDENIKKVSSPPGRCVTGSLETMQASGVPNPNATGQDVGNNPRGMIVQTMNDFGWKSMKFGTPLTLNSPYGNANVNVMSKDEWLSQVAAGNIPSGALIFQTRHSNWNATSPGSRGYDAAIAQQGGNSLWNGQPLSSLVYGNTQGVIGLTPDGMDANGTAGGGGFGSFLGGGLFGAMGELATGLANAFFEAFDPTGTLKELFGMGGATMSVNPGSNVRVTPGQGGAGATSINDPNARALLNAIADAEGTSQYPNQGYNTQFTGKQFAGLRHPREVISSGQYGSDAAGRYQFLSTTWDSYSNGRDMSPANQDAVALDLVTKKRGVNISDGLSINEIYQLGREWASIEGGPNGVAGGSYGGQAKYTAAQFMEMYRQYGGKVQGLQTGGIANMAGAGSRPTANMVSKSQEQFAQKIAEAVTPIVVPIPAGSGGGATVVKGGTGNDVSVPMLPSGDNSVVAMEYKYRITMGASV